MTEYRDSLGYPLTPDQAARRESEERREAASFVTDPQMERLAALRSEDRAAFDRIANGPLRMRFAGYERSKNLAAKYGNR